MTNDLSALPQHVRDALERFSDMLSHSAIVNPDNEAADKDALQTIRTELLRLSRDNEALRSKCNVLMSGSTRHLGRAERAEAELAQMKAERDAALASNRDCIDWFEQIRVDYYALRKRIAEAPVGNIVAGRANSLGGFHVEVATDSGWHTGQRVALLTVTDEEGV